MTQLNASTAAATPSFSSHYRLSTAVSRDPEEHFGGKIDEQVLLDRWAARAERLYAVTCALNSPAHHKLSSEVSELTSRLARSWPASSSGPAVTSAADFSPVVKEFARNITLDILTHMGQVSSDLRACYRSSGGPTEQIDRLVVGAIEVLPAIQQKLAQVNEQILSEPNRYRQSFAVSDLAVEFGPAIRDTLSNTLQAFRHNLLNLQKRELAGFFEDVDGQGISKERSGGAIALLIAQALGPVFTPPAGIGNLRRAIEQIRVGLNSISGSAERDSWSFHEQGKTLTFADHIDEVKAGPQSVITHFARQFLAFAAIRTGRLDSIAKRLQDLDTPNASWYAAEDISYLATVTNYFDRRDPDIQRIERLRGEAIQSLCSVAANTSDKDIVRKLIGATSEFGGQAVQPLLKTMGDNPENLLLISECLATLDAMAQRRLYGNRNPNVFSNYLQTESDGKNESSILKHCLEIVSRKPPFPYEIRFGTLQLALRLNDANRQAGQLNDPTLSSFVQLNPEICDPFKDLLQSHRVLLDED